MFPDVGAGNPLSHIWWLSLVVLFICTIASGAVIAYVTMKLQRKNQSDDSQTQEIEALKKDLHKCQVQCAVSRGKKVDREELEAQLLNLQGVLGQLFDRANEINVKVAEIEGVLKSIAMWKAEAVRKGE